MFQPKSTVLIVDDTPLNIDMLVEYLGSDYDISVATSGPEALELVEESPPDIILLDVMMPGMDGYEVCRILKSNQTSADIPIIFLTGMNTIEDKVRAFHLGAVDYMEKPFSPLEVRARLSAQLSLLQSRRELQEQNKRLEQKVRERTDQLVQTQNVIIESMANLAETRSPEIAVHILRTKHYVAFMAERLKEMGVFHKYFSEIDVDELSHSALLHDIGKVGISDRILLKKGRLSLREFEEIKKHTVIGKDILHRSRMKLHSSSFLRLAEEIAWCHHESMDGSGYPRGLQGEEIPLSARIMAVADVYDAMIGPRAYKPSTSHDEAVRYIMENKGTRFDPQVVSAFWDLKDQFFHLARYVFPDDVAALEAGAENTSQHGRG